MELADGIADFGTDGRGVTDASDAPACHRGIRSDVSGKQHPSGKRNL